jgi:hypothetical protein
MLSGAGLSQQMSEKTENNSQSRQHRQISGQARRLRRPLSSIIADASSDTQPSVICPVRRTEKTTLDGG